MQNKTKPRIRTGSFTRDIEIQIEGDTGPELKMVNILIHYFVAADGNLRKTTLWAFDDLAGRYWHIPEYMRYNSGQFSTMSLHNFHGSVLHHINKVARRLRVQGKEEEPQTYDSNGPRYRNSGTYRLDHDFR